MFRYLAVSLLCWLFSAQSSIAAPTDSATDYLMNALKERFPAVTRWELKRFATKRQTRLKTFRWDVDSNEFIIYQNRNIFLVKSPHEPVPVAYRVYGYQNAIEAAAPIRTGTVLTTPMVRIGEHETLNSNCKIAESQSLVHRKRLIHALKAGEAICKQYLEPLPTIMRNEFVTVVCKQGEVSVVSSGQAITNGNIGDTIQIRGRTSGKILFGQVRQQGEVDACA